MEGPWTKDHTFVKTAKRIHIIVETGCSAEIQIYTNIQIFMGTANKYSAEIACVCVNRKKLLP